MEAAPGKEGIRHMVNIGIRYYSINYQLKLEYPEGIVYVYL